MTDFVRANHGIFFLVSFYCRQMEGTESPGQHLMATPNTVDEGAPVPELEATEYSSSR